METNLSQNKPNSQIDFKEFKKAKKDYEKVIEVRTIEEAQKWFESKLKRLTMRYIQKLDKIRNLERDKEELDLLERIESNLIENECSFDLFQVLGKRITVLNKRRKEK